MNRDAFVPVLLALALVPRARADAPAAPELIIVEEYDRVHDRTTLSVDLGRVDGPDDLGLTALCLYRGTARTPVPRSVVIVFSGSSPEWRFLRYRELTFLVGGERVRARPDHKGTIRPGGVVEVMPADLPVADALKIAGPVAVEGKLGSAEFRLADAQRAALREFLACVEDPSLDANLKRREAELRKAAEDRKAAEMKAAELGQQRAKAAAAVESADKLLQEARALDRSSKTVKALEAYRAVVRRYPDSPAARVAEARIKAMMKAKR